MRFKTGFIILFYVDIIGHIVIVNVVIGEAEVVLEEAVLVDEMEAVVEDLEVVQTEIIAVLGVIILKTVSLENDYVNLDGI